MRSQRRDIGFEPLWNVATLNIKVATSIFTSLERRDIGSQCRDVRLFSPLERRDVALERRDVALFKAKITFLFAFTLLPLGLNPSAPCVTFQHQTLAEFHHHTRRRPLFCPPPPSLTLSPPSPSTPPSPLLLFRPFHTPRRCLSIGLVLHYRSQFPH